MTITDISFANILDEYPDLEADVRSILMTHVQDGATIAEIKDDYYKWNGVKFPIQNNVTEFLLSIPSVSAVCNEHGTRIFYIMPTEKTKHLYELIIQQKPAQQNVVTRSTYANGRQRWNAIDKQQQMRDSNRRFSNVQPVSTDNVTTTRSEFEDSLEKNKNNNNYNRYYEDNCNYLYNRFYSQQNMMVPQLNAVYNNKNIVNTNTSPKHFNTNKLNQFNDLNQQVVHHKLIEQNVYSNNYNNNNNNFYKEAPYFRQPTPTRPNSRATNTTTYTKSSTYLDSMYNSDADYVAHLYDFPLLGDDFLLYLARMELKCKFKKSQKVLQSGLCVSGQTISAAKRRIQQMRICNNNTNNRRIIVNIGSVDIMQGKPLVQIEHDFRELIHAMQRQSLTPILTTLAPLANYGHQMQTKTKLERFNEFIKRESHHLLVIDVWSCLVNERKHILFDCFQNAPRFVTGAPESYVFWNKIGRQRVLQLIVSKIEY